MKQSLQFRTFILAITMPMMMTPSYQQTTSSHEHYKESTKARLKTLHQQDNLDMQYQRETPPARRKHIPLGRKAASTYEQRREANLKIREKCEQRYLRDMKNQHNNKSKEKATYYTMIKQQNATYPLRSTSASNVLKQENRRRSSSLLLTTQNLSTLTLAHQKIARPNANYRYMHNDEISTFSENSNLDQQKSTLLTPPTWSPSKPEKSRHYQNKTDTLAKHRELEAATTGFMITTTKDTVLQHALTASANSNAPTVQTFAYHLKLPSPTSIAHKHSPCKR